MGINWLGVTEIPIVEEYIEEDLQSLTATEFSGHNFQFPEFAQPITGEESSENLTEGPRKSVASWQTFRPLLRTTIAVLGLVVVVILVVSFLKPGRSPDEDDEDDEALEDDDTADASWDVIDPLGHLNPRDPRDRIFIEYARLQQLLERTRNHRLVHQTPLEHAHQVGRENPELRKEFTQLNRTLYRTLYGRRPVSTEESRAAVENCRRIRNALR
jgi:hypothetical protein